jgi:hypothetical protein
VKTPRMTKRRKSILRQMAEGWELHYTGGPQGRWELRKDQEHEPVKSTDYMALRDMGLILTRGELSHGCGLTWVHRLSVSPEPQEEPTV